MRRIVLIFVLGLVVVGVMAGSAVASSFSAVFGAQYAIPPVFRGLLTFGDSAGGGSGIFEPPTDPSVTAISGGHSTTTIFLASGATATFHFNVTCLDVERVNGNLVAGYTTQLTGVQAPAVIMRNLPTGTYFINEAILGPNGVTAGSFQSAAHAEGFTAPSSCSPINGPEAAFPTLGFSLASSGLFGSSPGQFPYSLGYLAAEPFYACKQPAFGLAVASL